MSSLSESDGERYGRFPSVLSVKTPLGMREQLRASAAIDKAQAVVGRQGDSPMTKAPPFRDLHKQYPVENLQEALGEGIATGHATMPEFKVRTEAGGRDQPSSRRTQAAHPSISPRRPNHYRVL